MLTQQRAARVAATRAIRARPRQAELKHGRICMLAFLGYISVDLGFRAPGAPVVSSLEAHDVCVQSGHMLALLFVIAIFESLSYNAISEMLSGEVPRPPPRRAAATRRRDAPPRRAAAHPPRRPPRSARGVRSAPPRAQTRSRRCTCGSNTSWSTRTPPPPAA